VVFATEEEVDDDNGDQLDRRQGALGYPGERLSMGIFPIQLLKREVKLSAAAAVAVIATLVFIEGLWALWSMLLGATQFHLGFQFALFGLIGGPLLLVGSKLGYWYSLIDMTANAIICTASLTFMLWVDLFQSTSNDPNREPIVLGWTAVTAAATFLTLWSVRVLRSADVRSKFYL
jgi:hypothetical protein